MIDSVRESVILDHQRQGLRAQPGSATEAIAGHAVDLCLQESRTEDNPRYLQRDTWRDARRSYYRGRAREREAYARYAYTRLTLVGSVGGDDIVDDSEVDAVALARMSEFCACAIERAQLLGWYGPMFVWLLAQGATPTEAAAEIGISRATAYRALHRLRFLLTDARHLVEVAA